MKNKIKYLFLFFSSAMIVGCSESILDKEPTAAFDPATMFSSEEKATITVNGCYNAMAGFYVNTNFIQREGFTDNATADNGEQFVVVSTTNGFASDLWRRAYVMIDRCNVALAGISSMEDKKFKAGVKKRLLGECLAIRSLAYHELIFRFGDVPMYTVAVRNTEAMKVARTPKSDVYKLILANLDTAITYLPSVSTLTGANAGRISLECAKAIKARVCLFNGDYTLAAKMAKEVIASGKYTLLSNFLNNFTLAGKTGNTEGVLLIQRASGNSPSTGLNFNDAIAPKTAPYVATNATGYNMVVQDLVDEFELTDGTRAPEGLFVNSMALANARDPRFKATVLFEGCDPIGKFQFKGHARSGYHGRKYVNETPAGVGQNDVGQDMSIIRYADVLLMAAEGLIEGRGTVQTALDSATMFINRVRQRPGVLMPVIASGDQAQLRAALRHERRVELAMEGHREYDIIRWYANPGDAKPIAATVLENKFTREVIPGKKKNDPLGKFAFPTFPGWPEHYKLWPIPATEFEKNPNLGTTNNGY